MVDPRQRHWLGTPKWSVNEENIKKAKIRKANEDLKKESEKALNIDRLKKLLTLE